MRSFLLSILVLLSSCPVFANEFADDTKMEEVCEPNIHTSYAYASLGLVLFPYFPPALNISVGKRFAASSSFAVDAGANLATLIYYGNLRGYVNGLCYVNQKPCSQYYIGIGGSVGGFFAIEPGPGDNEGFVTPNFLVGKEFFNCNGKKRFFQAEALYPMYLIKEKVICPFPFITFAYGISF